MDNRTILFALHELPGIGWKTIHRLCTFLAALEQLPNLSREKLLTLELDRNKADAIIAGLTAEFAAERLEAYRRAGIEIICRMDADYPEWLAHTAQPPWVLYARGNRSLLHSPCLAMVGTRTPTAYGKKVAFQLAQELAEAGLTIVSGLARGIDSEVHRGALTRPGAGSTIGVLGCALDTVYPPENKGLYAQVEQHGLLLSEYPLGTPVHPGLFPLRNRIIAGLSLGTLVVEAALRSGSLITADQALDESRDCFAIPGPITSPKSAGTLKLIKEGKAKTVTCADDVLEEYEHYLGRKGAKSRRTDPSPEAELTEDETELLRHLTWEPSTIDRLLVLSGFAFGQMHTVLLSLSMKKLIQQLPGSTFVRI